MARLTELPIKGVKKEAAVAAIKVLLLKTRLSEISVSVLLNCVSTPDPIPAVAQVHPVLAYPEPSPIVP